LHSPGGIAETGLPMYPPEKIARFDGWFTGIEKKPLKLGDYSIAGLEVFAWWNAKTFPI